MATANFRALLTQNSTQVERPKPLPEGHYYAVVREQKFDVSRQKQTPFVRFEMVPEEATDDVDQELLAGIDLSQKQLRKDYFITPSALYRLTDMLDKVIGDPERSIEERIPEMRGARVLIQVTQRRSDNGDVFNDVGTVYSDQPQEVAEAA